MRRTTRATFGHRAFEFYTSLQTPRVPRGVSVMNPYAGAEVQRYLRMFLDTYFGDNDPRVLVLGINPGRFGAGITGITFTDPVVLEDARGIMQYRRKRVGEYLEKYERVFEAIAGRQ